MIEHIQGWEWREARIEEKISMLEAKLAEIIEAINDLTKKEAV